MNFAEQRKLMDKYIGTVRCIMHHGICAFSGADTVDKAEQNLRKVLATGEDFEFCASSTTRIGYAGVTGNGEGYRFPTDVLSSIAENGKRVVDDHYLSSLCQYIDREKKSYSDVYKETRDMIEEEQRIMGYATPLHDEVIVDTKDFAPISLWVKRSAPMDIKFVISIISLETGLNLEVVDE